MVVVPRTLKRGDIEFVTAIVTEQYGADISGCTYKIAHVLDSQKNDDQAGYPWEDPHAESGPGGTSNIYLAKKLVTAALDGTAKTKYRVFVRVTDNPEVDAVDCGTYTVVP